MTAMPFSAGFPFTETDAPRLSGMTVSRYCPAATFSTVALSLSSKLSSVSGRPSSVMRAAFAVFASDASPYRTATLAPACEKVTRLSRSCSAASVRPSSVLVSSSAPFRSSSAAVSVPLRRGWSELFRTCTTAEAALPFSSSADRVTGVFSLRASRLSKVRLFWLFRLSASGSSTHFPSRCCSIRARTNSMTPGSGISVRPASAMYCAMLNVISCVFPVSSIASSASPVSVRVKPVPAVPPSKYLPSTGVSHAGSEYTPTVTRRSVRPSEDADWLYR